MKKILYTLLILLIAYLVLALVSPSTVKVERNITVENKAEAIRPLLSDLTLFHDKWSPWTEKDLNAEVKYSGTAGQVGHQMEWSSKVKEVGTGTMQILSIKNDSIIQKFTFEGMGDSKAYYILKENEGKTEVTWGMLMSAPFIFRPMMFFMNAEKMIGPDYEKGLLNLKSAAEELKQGSTTNFEIKEMEWPETYYAGTKFETVPFEKLQAFFSKNLPAISEALGKEKVEPASAPLAIYNWYDEKKGETNLSAAFRVAKGVQLKGFEIHTFPATKVLLMAYYGDYSKIIDAHMALDTYLKEKGLKSGPVFEEYVTDPMSEKDTAKWLTNIYYTLK